MSCSRGLEMGDVCTVEKEGTLTLLASSVSNDQAAGMESEAKAVGDREARAEFQQGLRLRSHGLYASGDEEMENKPSR